MRSLALADEIERTYPVTRWHIGDVPVWPLARWALHHNIYLQSLRPSQRTANPPQRRRAPSRIARVARSALTPVIDVWRSRSDLRHLVLVPRRAHALFLGNGDAFDFVDGAWRDRFGEPLICALQKTGRSTFLVQYGDLRQHLPWRRPTFAANTIINWAGLSAAGLARIKRFSSNLPDHERVLQFLHRSGVPTQGVTAIDLGRLAAGVTTTAFGFERLLKAVRPSLCFMLSYFSPIGFAFSMACRRRGVLSIELQHGGCGARNEGYCWSAVPDDGYTVLPAVFWSWTEEDAAAIESWSGKLKSPWHRSIHGGHPQLPAWFDDSDPHTRAFDERIGVLRARAPADREILVALQAIGGHEDLWNELAGLIERAPSTWRWWLRHRGATLGGGDHVGRLSAMRRPNVLIEEATSFPLPALLRHMDALISIRSGAAIEAAMFGLRPIFLSPAARDVFPNLFETGTAEIIEDMTALEARLLDTPRRPKTRAAQPDLPDVLSRLESMAADYSALCTTG